MFIQEKLHVVDCVPLFDCDWWLLVHDGLNVDAAGGGCSFVLGAVLPLPLGEHRAPVAAGEFSLLQHDRHHLADGLHPTVDDIFFVQQRRGQLLLLLVHRRSHVSGPRLQVSAAAPFRGHRRVVREVKQSSRICHEWRNKQGALFS